MQKSGKLLLLIPAMWASFLDIFLTIFYQKSQYWAGDLSKANEANPIGGAAMQMHVSGIFIVCGAWLIAIPLLGYYLPGKLSKIFLLFVVIAHSIGTSSWLTHLYGFWWLIIVSAFNAFLYILVDDYTSKISLK